MIRQEEERKRLGRDIRATLDIWGISDLGFEAVWDEEGIMGARSRRLYI